MKAIWRFLIKMLVLNLILVPFMVVGPMIFFGLPIFLFWSDPHADYSVLARIYFWLGPLSCAFWMLVSCHWPTVRRARREGNLANWREAEGGIVCTVTKATVYMFAGLFGSYFFEFALLLIFICLRLHGSLLPRLALFPFATFAPVLLLWLCRWMRSRRQVTAY